ncbi:Predicted thiol-disulfide oxidoreductase YuxK, DCC family [Halobiforma haloterrestris]|uniref:Predicted thiol-disulfide oxidoreductase YuxK, DCC family n=1 Tax=Natronobacterium haloterrestre TaxID=148448 RepID=A0A1I1D1V0_NATHA|nr:thiol-disulfide oxidoreductase DCC family protein [Halobiforma haloterrestris]SFB68969.1 Predicted thiol-disulfide oxidoreductase YuxK, DCC family [Halobiforma haloterrestris]
MSDSDADPDPDPEPTLEDLPEDAPVVLFDGVCNLCNGFVQFLVPRDTEGMLYFASLQSDAATALLADHEPSPHDLESVVLVEGDDCYVKSDAVIRIARHLGGIYALAAVGRLVPRRLRDWLYDFVAANRYDWFGKREQCMVPTGDVRERFLG